MDEIKEMVSENRDSGRQEMNYMRDLLLKGREAQENSDIKIEQLENKLNQVI